MKIKGEFQLGSLNNLDEQLKLELEQVGLSEIHDYHFGPRGWVPLEDVAAGWFYLENVSPGLAGALAAEGVHFIHHLVKKLTDRLKSTKPESLKSKPEVTIYLGARGFKEFPNEDYISPPHIAIHLGSEYSEEDILRIIRESMN